MANPEEGTRGLDSTTEPDDRWFFLAALWLLMLLMPVYPKYDIILLALGTLWALWRCLPQRPKLGLQSFGLPLAVFFGWMLVSTMFGIGSSYAWEKLFFWLPRLLAFPVLIDLARTRRRLCWLLLLLIPVHPKYDKILLALGAFWVLWRWLPQRPRLGLKFLHLPLAAFFGWMLLSTIVAVDSFRAWDHYFSWVAHLLAFLMFIDVVRTRRQLAALAVALVLGHAYLGVACVVDYFSGVYRIGGPGDYWPTVLGCYLNFALPWTLGIAYLVKNSNLRFLLALVVLLLLFALGATLARASLIGLFVTLLVLSKYFFEWRRWRFQLLLVSLFLLLLLFPGFLSRLHLIGPETLGDLEFSRPMFWKSSLDLLDEGTRLITGVGMGDSFNLVFRHQPVATVDGDFYQLPHAHNFLIHYLVIWGLPGLLAYLWFVAACTLQIAKTYRQNPSRVGRWVQWVALAALMGFWVEELFHVSVLYRNNMTFYWWTLAAGIVAGRLPADERELGQDIA